MALQLLSCLGFSVSLTSKLKKKKKLRCCGLCDKKCKKCWRKNCLCTNWIGESFIKDRRLVRMVGWSRPVLKLLHFNWVWQESGARDHQPSSKNYQFVLKLVFSVHYCFYGTWWRYETRPWVAIWTLNSFLRSVTALTTTGTSGHAQILRVACIISWLKRKTIYFLTNKCLLHILFNLMQLTQKTFVVDVSHPTSTLPSMFRSASLKKWPQVKYRKKWNELL